MPFLLQTQVLFDDLEEEFSLTAKPKKPVNKAAASTMPVAMIASRAGRKAEVNSLLPFLYR